MINPWTPERSFALQYHPYIAHLGFKNIRNGHQLKKAPDCYTNSPCKTLGNV